MEFKMFAKGAKKISMSGISTVNINAKTNTGIPVMYMTATISPSENRFDTNGSVQNQELYNLHYEEVEKDYSEFRKWVKEERDRLSDELKGE